ncbi:MULTISPECIES: glutathione S-transferase family protein [Gammaproteobacteria]|uniref:glutathione S-transferase family protein n=1 Tax=Gammaproteobacteria TaxID=1236 RepID=UPI000DD0EB9B|nr:MULTISPECIES: glutathione S-transferase family protein [Gammaproteobacteria]RTE86451.1 glutathione S-transferase family protein [Aliidiomarina sp. B3213]TCZ90994.1 glutathione S-transferase family protein [Lysobacter sp. N42]
MKLYEMAIAPNPRRVRMFMAEKGLLDQVERVELDLQKGENLTPEFITKNPMKKVPVLELDDGTCIPETMAICRFVEESHPETMNLMGETPKEKAEIEKWTRWIEFYFFLPTGMAFQHLSGYFKDRMEPNESWGLNCKNDVEKFFHKLNKHLADNEWIAANRFTVADINAFCTVEFARVVDVRIKDEQTHLQRWFDAMKSRPSADV